MILLHHGQMPSHDPFPYDFEHSSRAEPGHPALSPAQAQAAQIVALRDELTRTRRDLAFAHRARDEAETSENIARQLTIASLTETRDLCLPSVTKSLLYATVETLDLIAEDGGLPDEYLKVRKRSIEQLERLDAKGVYTAQEENERQEALRRRLVLLRFADIMRPRQLVEAEEAVLLLSAQDPSSPRIVLDGTQPPGARPSP